MTNSPYVASGAPWRQRSVLILACHKYLRAERKNEKSEKGSGALKSKATIAIEACSFHPTLRTATYLMSPRSRPMRDKHRPRAVHWDISRKWFTPSPTYTCIFIPHFASKRSVTILLSILQSASSQTFRLCTTIHLVLSSLENKVNLDDGRPWEELPVVPRCSTSAWRFTQPPANIATPPSH